MGVATGDARRRARDVGGRRGRAATAFEIPGRQGQSALNVRSSWGIRGIGLALVALLGTDLSVVVVRQRREAVAFNAVGTAEVDVVPSGGFATVGAAPGVVAFSTYVSLIVKKPITLLDARPYAMPPGAQVLATRVVFWGTPRGRVTRSGHVVSNAITSGSTTCAWPPRGYGPSYPATGLAAERGDPLSFLFYVRLPAGAGKDVIGGYVVRYRTAHGRVVTLTGDRGKFVIEVGTGQGGCSPGDPADPNEAWTRPYPGFPS